MAKAWISNAVLEKGAEGRRWLSNQGNDSNNEFADDNYEGAFSRNNSGLSLHMRHTKGKSYYSLRVIEVSRTRTLTTEIMADLLQPD